MGTPALRGRRYWFNLLRFAAVCAAAGLLAAQYVGVPFYLSYGYTHPQRLPVCCETPADRGWPYEAVAFQTADGLTLRGWYLPGRNRAAIVTLHGLASNRLMMLDAAGFLREHDYGVLLLDLRAHGESDGSLYPYGGPEAEDVRAAVAYLRGRADVDPARIGLLGFSLGAQTGLLGAAQEPALRAVAADGPGATDFEDWPSAQTWDEFAYVPFDWVFYHLLRWRSSVAQPQSILSAVRALSPRPVLLIGGGHEKRRLEAFYAAAQAPKQLWIVPEAGHLEALQRQPAAYAATVTRFFDQALLTDAP